MSGLWFSVTQNNISFSCLSFCRESLLHFSLDGSTVSDAHTICPPATLALVCTYLLELCFHTSHPWASFGIFKYLCHYTVLSPGPFPTDFSLFLYFSGWFPSLLKLTLTYAFLIHILHL